MKKIIPKKFSYAPKIGKETQENMLMEFYKLDTNKKHSFIPQTTICFFVSGNKKGCNKPTYTYFLMKGEEFFSFCKSCYLFKLKVLHTKVILFKRRFFIIWVSQKQKTEMLAYINSFYVFASHYCRAKTKKIPGGRINHWKNRWSL